MLNEILEILKYVCLLNKFNRYIFIFPFFVFVFSKDKEIRKVEGQIIGRSRSNKLVCDSELVIR